jgi:GDP-4-dehydro-6-deoxy-D-mannose reductase
MNVGATRRLLATGRHGFVGGVLARMLDSSTHLAWTLIDIPPDFDLRDASATSQLIAEARPDAVIHLAAQSAVPESFRDPETTLQVNVVGTLHLLQALAASGFQGRLLFIGTGDVYGLVPESELPIAETRLPHPRNPYAVSKLAAEALCRQWQSTTGLEIVLARPFNHIGPGQSERFAVSDFARQIAEIRMGTRPAVIRTGDLAVTRDFTDVHDVVEAYLTLLEHGEPGEIYNVCSGIEFSLQALLDEMISLSGVTVQIQAEPGGGGGGAAGAAPPPPPPPPRD